MLRLALKNIRHRPGRLILTALSIVLSVAFISGTFVFTSGVKNSFDTMFKEIYGGSDIIVQPTEEPEGNAQWSALIPSMDEANIARIESTPGVASTSPSIQGVASLLKEDGTVAGINGAPNLVFNWEENNALNPSTIVAGTAPLTSRDVVLDVDAADRADYEIGDTVKLSRFGEGEVYEYELVGLARFGSSNALNTASLIFFTYEEAQSFARMEGRVATVSVEVAEGHEVQDVIDSLNSALPADATAKSAEELIKESSAEVQEILDLVNIFVLAFAFIAVFVGAFMITNTFRTIVTQRTREIGLLRAISAKPGDVRRMILLEAVAIGTVASVAGIGLGYLGALGIKALLTATGMGGAIGNLGLPMAAIIWGLTTGIGTTVVAAMLPAFHASRITPMEALREAGTSSRRPLRLRTVIGLAMILAGIGLAVAGAVSAGSRGALVVGVGGVLAIIGAIMVAAAIVVPAATATAPLFRRLFGVDGKLAMTNAAREPRRTANTAGALMIGVVLLALITTFGASMKSVVRDQLVGNSSADFFVSGGVQDPFAPISNSQIEAMRQVDGVRYAHQFGLSSMQVDGKAVDVVGIDAASAEEAYTYKSEPGFSRLNGGVFVSPAVLEEGGYSLGDSITLQGPDATLTLPITGQYLQEGDPAYWVDWEQFQELHNDVAAIQVWIVMDSGADLEEVRQGLESVIEDNPRLVAETTDEYIRQVNSFLDQVLFSLAAMLAMALIIAVAGVANTLSLSVTERTREIGLLRAVGVRRASVRKMITLESVFIALLGALLGLVVGVGIAYALVSSLREYGFESFAIPWGGLVGYTLLAVVAGILAALAPARRASKLDILEAIATE